MKRKSLISVKIKKKRYIHRKSDIWFQIKISIHELIEFDFKKVLSSLRYFASNVAKSLAEKSALSKLIEFDNVEK